MQASAQLISQQTNGTSQQAAKPETMPNGETEGALPQSVEVQVETQRSASVRVSVDTQARTTALIHAVRIGLSQELDDAAQHELGRLATLLPRLATINNVLLIDEAELAVGALLQAPTQVIIAREIRKRLRRQVHIDEVLNSSPATAVSLGLAIFTACLIPTMALVVSLMRRLGPDDLFNVPLSMYSLVFVFGAAGSIVSIMVRIQQFHFKDKDGLPLLFTGLFRPIVGIGFAFFVFAALESGVITVSFPTEKAPFLSAALAFVAGFSERFGQNIATKAENLAGSDAPSGTRILSAQGTEKQTRHVKAG